MQVSFFSLFLSTKIRFMKETIATPVKKLTQARFQELLKNAATLQANVDNPELTYVTSLTDGSRICNPLTPGKDEDFLKKLFRKGITEQFKKIDNNGNIAAIGFNPSEQKWYGWSLRGIDGFGIGYKLSKDSILKDGGWTVGTTVYKKYVNKFQKYLEPKFVAKNLDDCKVLAEMFAISVS